MHSQEYIGDSDLIRVTCDGDSNKHFVLWHEECNFWECAIVSLPRGSTLSIGVAKIFPRKKEFTEKAVCTLLLSNTGDLILRSHPMEYALKNDVTFGVGDVIGFGKNSEGYFWYNLIHFIFNYFYAQLADCYLFIYFVRTRNGKKIANSTYQHLGPTAPAIYFGTDLSSGW